MTRIPALMYDIEDITRWLDESQVSTVTSILKLTEEVGEVAAAYIGMTGDNPRKGVTNNQAAVLAELADVAVTALCALQHMTQDIGQTYKVLSEKLDDICRRAGIPTESSDNG